MEMYKLQTQLSNFRFNSIIRIGVLKIEWFIYFDDEEEDDDSRCFTYEELNVFLNYVINNDINFVGKKEYYISDNDETPNCSIYNLIGNDNITHPKNLILRPTPQMNKYSEISICMDIILTDQNGEDKNNYDLPFMVVGKTLY